MWVRVWLCVSVRIWVCVHISGSSLIPSPLQCLSLVVPTMGRTANEATHFNTTDQVCKQVQQQTVVQLYSWAVVQRISGTTCNSYIIENTRKYTGSCLEWWKVVLTIWGGIHGPGDLLNPQATDAISLLPWTSFSAHVYTWSVTSMTRIMTSLQLCSSLTPPRLISLCEKELGFEASIHHSYTSRRLHMYKEGFILQWISF